MRSQREDACWRLGLDAVSALPDTEATFVGFPLQTLKSTVAVYNADMLVSQREGVSLQIKTDLLDRALDFGMIIEDVAITDLHFGQAYEQAIERKTIAVQDAERAKLLVQKAVQEKRQKIVEAEGESQSAELIGKSIRENPAYLNLQKIKAAVGIAQTVSQAPPACRFRHRSSTVTVCLLLGRVGIWHGAFMFKPCHYPLC